MTSIRKTGLWMGCIQYREFGVSNISMWAMTLEKSDLQIGVGTIGILTQQYIRLNMPM
ncbi:MAG: hypothetical protein IPK08_21260 [Bacteroidetes bacterium]|nr:hypothetical protein [Bacteroidota bacterium]